MNTEKEKNMSTATVPISHWVKVACEQKIGDFWRVDAWKTFDDKNPAAVAFIDDLTGRVIFVDPAASTDKAAQAVISARVRSLEATLAIAKKVDHIEVSMHGKHGSLIADLEPDEMSEAGDDRIYIGFVPDESPSACFDLLGAAAKEDSIGLRVWSDVFSDVSQHSFDISKNDIRAAASDLALPDRVTFSFEDLGLSSDEEDEDIILDAAGEKLTSEYGFCHKGFSAHIKRQDEGCTVTVSDIEWDTEA